eukprot:2792928-Amphidinium_carterae.1
MGKNIMETIMEDNFLRDSSEGGNEQGAIIIAQQEVRPSNNGTKDIKCRFCGKGFSQFIHDTDIQTFAATPSSMAMRLLLTIAIIKQFTVFTTDIASACLNTPIDKEVIVPKEYDHNRPNTLWRMTKAFYGLRTSPKQWQEQLSTILQKLGFTRLKSDASVFANKQPSIYIMAYVDDLLVIGDNDVMWQHNNS